MFSPTPRLVRAASVLVVPFLFALACVPRAAGALGPAAPAGRSDSTPQVAAAATPDSVGLIARLLAANGAPLHRATPAARAILKYARQRALDPLLIVGIIGVENATLTPRARSGVGARGVMQVMPSWKRDITDCGGDLHDVVVNVCFGTRILQIAMDASTSVREALLRYNGCVRAPGCHRYANAVFSQAGRAVVLSRMETASAAVASLTPSAAAPSVLAGAGALTSMPEPSPAVVTP